MGEGHNFSKLIKEKITKRTTCQKWEGHLILNQGKNYFILLQNNPADTFDVFPIEQCCKTL